MSDKKRARRSKKKKAFKKIFEIKDELALLDGQTICVARIDDDEHELPSMRSLNSVLLEKLFDKGETPEHGKVFSIVVSVRR